ncbi:hypothetical protein M8J77_012835 [Diaphorina citri]|nr:hypothetical protein M8J77_012835 [Diaphorina citri]
MFHWLVLNRSQPSRIVRTWACSLKQSSFEKLIASLVSLVGMPPKIIDEETSGDIEVPEGGNITLQCRAKGNPTPRISWKRDDSRPIKLKRGRDNNANENITGEVLTLKRMDRRQSGAIFCIASNDIPPAVSKRMLIHVTFKPRVTVPILSYGSPLEADVTLECNIEAYPFAINYWKFKPSTKQEHVLTNGSKYILTETRTGYEVNLTVVIRNLSRQDLGEYKCYSSNGLGESESGFVKIHDTHLAIYLKEVRGLTLILDIYENLVISETQRATVPPTTRVITTTTTRLTTPRPPPVVTITTRRIAQLFTTRVPLVEFAENAILGDPIASKGRKTKSSSYQSLDINTSISSYFKPANSRTLYTITIIYTLYLRLRDCY